KKFGGMGSVKTNVGHLDTAAGLAGCIKLAFCLSQGEIPPSLHYHQPNPAIDFEDSPFYVVDKRKQWQEAGKPRRAAVSSFGIGGTNAHAIFEEFPARTEAGSPEESGGEVATPCLVPLSARNSERLLAYAKELLHFLAPEGEEQGTPSLQQLRLADLAYTLQVGMAAMAKRVIFVVDTIPELISRLAGFTEGKEDIDRCFSGATGEAKDLDALFEAEDSQQLIQNWLTKGSFEKLAKLWAKGVEVSWEMLYPQARPKRVSLPTYPFARERYWIPEAQTNSEKLARCGQQLAEEDSDAWVPRTEEEDRLEEAISSSNSCGANLPRAVPEDMLSADTADMGE